MSVATDFISSMPWVTRQPIGVRCDGHRWNQVSRKALREGKLEKYRCKRAAHYQFTALPTSSAKDGTYCWAHLESEGIFGDMDEEDRTLDYIKEHWKAYADERGTSLTRLRGGSMVIRKEA